MENNTDFFLKGISDVSAERLRQITEENHGSVNDDKYLGGELAIAGACYAAYSAYNLNSAEIKTGPITGVPTWWPWDVSWWKPSDNRRNLVKAAALIIAEIDRIDRKNSGKEVLGDSSKVEGTS